MVIIHEFDGGEIKQYFVFTEKLGDHLQRHVLSGTLEEDSDRRSLRPMVLGKIRMKCADPVVFVQEYKACVLNSPKIGVQ